MPHRTGRGCSDRGFSGSGGRYVAIVHSCSSGFEYRHSVQAMSGTRYMCREPILLPFESLYDPLWETSVTWTRLWKAFRTIKCSCTGCALNNSKKCHFYKGHEVIGTRRVVQPCRCAPRRLGPTVPMTRVFSDFYLGNITDRRLQQLHSGP